MKDEEILKLVLKALERLHNEDQFLLDKDLCERCIMHKLAEKMAMLFPEYDVDCEYNRDTPGKAKKEIEVIKTDCAEEEEPYYQIHSSYPDIVVHERGDNDNNLLVIEMKIKNDADTLDLEKLIGLTEFEQLERNHFHYQLGMFLQVNLQQGEDKFLLYKEGKVVKPSDGRTYMGIAPLYTPSKRAYLHFKQCLVTNEGETLFEERCGGILDLR